MNQFSGTNYHDLNLNWLLGQMKNCLAEWETTKGEWTALETDNEEFKAYVTNYFDNLDVTQEISDKIDALVEDGTLLRILTEDEGEGSPLSDTVGDWLAAHITQETGYVIDDTLTVQGAAADAKATGDAITEVKSAIQSADITLFTDQMYLRHGYIDANGVWKGVTSSTLGHRIYPVNAGDFVSITANATNNTRVAVLTSDSTPIADAQAPISADASFSGTNITKGTTWTGTMPSDAKWLYVNTQYTDSGMPSAISVNGRDILHPVWDDTVAAIASAISDYGTNANGLFAGLAFGTATAITATEQTPADYNNYTTAGNYYAATTSVVQYINNKPAEVTVAHRLFVLATTAASRIIQIVITNAASVNVYKRYYGGTSWSNWTKLLDDTVIPFDEKASNATTIASGENINLYITPGNYKIASTSVAENITGLPILTGGRLTILTLSAESLVLQIFNRQDNSAGVYARYGKATDITDPSTTTWGPWKRYMTDDLVESEFTAKLSKNLLPYYTLDSSVFAVGNLSNDGEYNANTKYRVCTPDLQIANTDVQIRPREGFRVSFRLYTNGVYSSTLTPGSKGATLTAGQQYKMIIRRATEDTSETVTVADFYDKAQFFNLIQKIGSISVTGDPRYVFADYGLLPQGVFYPGLTDTYTTYDYNTTAATVYSAFDALVTAHGEYITKTDLGVCSDGVQHVYMYDFNPQQKSGGVMYESLPTIFLLCGQHGYEKVSVYAAYYMLKHMIESPSENPILNYLRNHVRIVCIPIANPYGFNQKAYKNYNGVNLNRNWDADWRTGPDEDDPTSKDYAGEAPFDQPETAAIRDAFLTLKSGISVAIDFHTNGSDTAVENYGEMNCILYTDRITPLWMCAKKAVRYHIKDITSHFAEQYNLTIADDVFCGMTITNHSHHGQAQQWFDKQEKIAYTFEVFPGFPGESSYTADTIKASEEMIANFLVTVLNYIK